MRCPQCTRRGSPCLGDVAEDLVVGAVLGDDEDDVRDGAAQARDDGRDARRIVREVVREGLPRQAREGVRAGHGEGEEAALFELEGVLVAAARRVGVLRGAVDVPPGAARVRAGDAPAVRDVEPAPVARDRDGVRVEAGRDEAGDVAGRARRVERNDGEGTVAAVGDVEGALVGREGERVGVRPAQGGQGAGERVGRRDGGDAGELAGGGDVDDADGVRAGVRDVEAATGAIEEKGRRLLPDGDAPDDAARREVHLGELGVPLAAHERPVLAHHGDRPRELAAGPRLRDEAHVPAARAAGRVDHRQRIVLVLRDDESLARRRHGDPGRKGPLLHAEPAEPVRRAVAELDRRFDGGPLAARPGANPGADDLVGPAADVEALPVGRERHSAEVVRHADDLELARGSRRHVVDEDVLAGGLFHALAVAVEDAVVAGREDQERRAVGRERGRDGATGAKRGRDGDVWVEAEEDGAGGGVRRQGGAIREAEDVGGEKGGGGGALARRGVNRRRRCHQHGIMRILACGAGDDEAAAEQHGRGAPHATDGEDRGALTAGS
jgi:hypothetical protein